MKACHQLTDEPVAVSLNEIDASRWRSGMPGRSRMPGRPTYIIIELGTTHSNRIIPQVQYQCTTVLPRIGQFGD